MWHAHDGMGWWMIFAVLVWVVFVGLIAWAVVIVSREGSHRSRTGDRDDAEAIARRRYASGEIDREAFEQLRRDLQS